VTEPEARFDEVIHAPLRLRITSMLSVAPAEFAAMRDQLDVSDSVLSKHIRTLEEAGYVHVMKVRGVGRIRTRVALTVAGTSAFAGHIAELRRLANGAI
jgi:DNA-binding MarR family transcriptional regulator